MSILTYPPLKVATAFDADMYGGEGQRVLDFGPDNASWSTSSTSYEAMRPLTDEMSYQSLDNMNHLDPMYTEPSPHPPESNGVSSFGFYTSSVEGFPGRGFIPFTENERLPGTTHMSSPRSAISGNVGYTSHPVRDHPAQRPGFERRISQNNNGSNATSYSNLEVPKRPRLRRQKSDQSAVSTPSSGVANEKTSSSSITPSNEAHIIAERRYRNNLNAKIDQIRSALENAQFRSRSKDSYRSRGGTYFVPEISAQEGENTSPASSSGKDRRRKADILDEAAEYIRFADIELRHLSEEVQWLTQALAAAQTQNY